MRVEHSRLASSFHPHGLGTELALGWRPSGGQKQGTLPGGRLAQASFQKVMVTWLPYLDCIQRVADDDAALHLGDQGDLLVTQPWT